VVCVDEVGTFLADQLPQLQGKSGVHPTRVPQDVKAHAFPSHCIRRNAVGGQADDGKVKTRGPQAMDDPMDKPLGSAVADVVKDKQNSHSF
jgi:hypothetical protein